MKPYIQINKYRRMTGRKDFRKMSKALLLCKIVSGKMTANDWVTTLLEDSEDLSHICEWEKFSADDMVNLLSIKPQYSSCCDLQKLSEEHWRTLLAIQPELEENRKAF